MKEHTIRWFATGMGPEREKGRFTHLHFGGQKVNVPYMLWYLEGAGKKILVDGGCSAEEYRMVMKGGSTEERAARAGERFQDVVDVATAEAGLKNFGFAPEDVDIVILTHLHYDHVLGVKKFKNARILVQEEEWKGICNHHILLDSGFPPLWFFDGMRNMEFLKGDTELFPGIEVILTPGHTQGGQSVVVNTKQGKYVIAGFCCLYDNFYPPQPSSKGVQRYVYPVIPPGVHKDATLAYDSTLKLLQMFGDKILPVHEQALMKTDHVPAQ